MPEITLRDYFAGQALAMWLSCETAQHELLRAVFEKHHDDPAVDRRRIMREILARRAYAMADAMLAEREKQRQKRLASRALRRTVATPPAPSCQGGE